MNPRNIVGHCQFGTSDKIYIVSVRDNSDGTFAVIGKWGRRGRVVGCQVKVSTNNESAAYAEQKRFFEGLSGRKYYEDIQSTDYHGPAKMDDKGIVELLEHDDKVFTEEEASSPAKPKALPDGDFVAICVDNSGIEGLFDDGIEYVAERHDDVNLIWVYDRLGKRREYFRERFLATSGV